MSKIPVSSAVLQDASAGCLCANVVHSQAGWEVRPPCELRDRFKSMEIRGLLRRRREINHRESFLLFPQSVCAVNLDEGK